MGKSVQSLRLVFLLLVFCLADKSFAQEPFKLGVEQKYQIQDPNPYPDYPAYPAPKMVGQPMRPAAAPVQHRPNPPALRANVNQNIAPPPVMRPQAPIRAVLPDSFLGVWQVIGQRQRVDALPEFQAGASNAFSPNTSNTWQIEGNPNSGYAFVSDTGVKTQVIVDQVKGNTAWLRYQHQIGNTMAQEAIVMQLNPGGGDFSGLERISIVKPSEKVIRAKVTYQLMGRKQR